MEQPNHIDDLMRQRLRQTEVPPPAFVWPNVERALRRRKRRFFFIWFLTGGLAAGILAAGLWWMFGNQPETPAATQPMAHTHSGVPAPVATPEKSTATTVDAGADNDRLEKQTPGYTGKRMPATNSPEAAVRHNRVAPASRPSFAAQSAGKKPLSADIYRSEAQVQTVVAETGATIPTPAPEYLEAAAKGQFEIATAPLPVSLGLLPMPARENTLATVKTPPAKTKRAPRKCYDFHTHPNAWLVDAYAGPSWAAKRFKTSDSELQDYLLDRERTEIRTWGYNAGLRASYLFAGNFLLRTGLHFDHFEEQFEYIDPDFIRYNITVTQQYINGQWVSVTDTIGIEYGTNYLKTYNRYAMLDIPLQAALELRSGATGVSLNLGGSLNLLFEKRGSILDTTGKPASFTPGSGPNEVFRTSLGLSLMGSIQWFYHLNPRTRVFVEPYYRHILDPVTRPELPYEQSYGVGGVRLGLTRIFD